MHSARYLMTMNHWFWLMHLLNCDFTIILECTSTNLKKSSQKLLCQRQLRGLVTPAVLAASLTPVLHLILCLGHHGPGLIRPRKLSCVRCQKSSDLDYFGDLRDTSQSPGSDSLVSWVNLPVPWAVTQEQERNHSSAVSGDTAASSHLWPS